MNSHDIPLKKAITAYKPLYQMLAFVALTVVISAAYIGIPPSDFSEFIPMMLISIGKFLFFMTVLALLAFAGCRFSVARTKERIGQYMESETFAFGVMGFFVLVFSSMLFIAQKCMIPFLNPFGYWDPVFADLDKTLHGGIFPQIYILDVIKDYPQVASLLDRIYISWYLAITLTGAYVLYCDRNFKRRMQFMWTYVFSFLIVGSMMATVFSSVGPAFYADFMDATPQGYLDYIQALVALDQQTPLHVVRDKHWLLQWTTNKDFIDLNSISAMPSMHNATMLLCVLYLRTVNPVVFILALAMSVGVLVASIFTGYHYAIDAYVGYAIVIPIWFLSGKLIKRLYPGMENMVLTR